MCVCPFRLCSRWFDRTSPQPALKPFQGTKKAPATTRMPVTVAAFRPWRGWQTLTSVTGTKVIIAQWGDFVSYYAAILVANIFANFFALGGWYFAAGRLM